jgi:ABC-type multidrug transport system ATPase subunit/ABC-type multidrug transport system permease subunit
MPVTKTASRVQALAASWRAGDFTIEPVTAEIGAGRLVAIIGPRGAGKSTLLELLAGVRTPSKGQVTHPPEVGFVPQDDIVHAHLPLRRALSYATRLRGGDGDHIAEVLDTLGLTDAATLGGGERKRASIAVELLAKPDALFLDEPTSGLDPASGRDLLRHLRSLVDDGNTVVLTTSTPSDLALCDDVFVLHAGRLVFTGTPDAVLEHFGVTAAEEVYEKLAGEPPEWSPTAVVFEPPQPVPERSRVSGLRQWWLLTLRTVELLARNRLTLAILIGSPVVIALLSLTLFRPGAADSSPTTAVTILFWLAFGGFFFGLTYGLSQICDEFAILRRERQTGLRLTPYLLSKVAVMVPLLCLVDALLLGMLSVTDRLPALDLTGNAKLFGTVALASLCALTLGLLCASVVSNPSQAALALPVPCVPQLLFAGAFLPVPAMADVGRWLSYATSTRWAFEALGHTAAPQRGGPPLWTHWSLLAGFAVLFAAATVLVLRRKAGPAR